MATVAGAGVAALTLPKLTFGQGLMPLTIAQWVETPTTTFLRDSMTPLMEKVKAGGVHALTPDEWSFLANRHQAWSTEHGKLANLHHLDRSIAAQQPALNSRGKTGVDYIVQQGMFYHHSRLARAMQATATYLKGQQPAIGEEFLLPNNAMECGGFFLFNDLVLGVIAILVPEIAIFILLMQAVSGGMGVYLCDQGYSGN